MASQSVVLGMPSSGDVAARAVGPASSTDDAVATWDGTTGKLLQDSGVLLSSKADVLTALNEQTGTTYTFVLADGSPQTRLVRFDNALAIAVTVPPNSTVPYPIGTLLSGEQAGAGQVTLVAGVGVTLNTALTLKTREQFSPFALLKTAADTWTVFGDLYL